MIIVMTNSGARFINEAETLMIIHDKETARVTVHPKSWQNEQPSPFHLLNVEKVIYTTAQNKEYTCEGSELEKLQKENDELFSAHSNLRMEYLSILSERNELKERLEKLESKPDPDRWWSDEADRAPVNILIGYIAKNDYCGYGVRIGTVFRDHNIKTVGDLLRIGRQSFGKYNKVGRGSLRHIDNALEELYNIKGW